MTQDEIITHLLIIIKLIDCRKLPKDTKAFIRELEKEIKEHEPQE